MTIKILCLSGLLATACTQDLVSSDVVSGETNEARDSAAPDAVASAAARSISAGRATFRFDTFGDEAFWGDKLKLHQAIAGAGNGGVGGGVSPRVALGLGFKVDL